MNRYAALAATAVLLLGATGCANSKTKREVFVDPVATTWEVEFPGDVTTDASAPNVVVYSARYGRDYYGVVDATVGAGLVVNLDNDANNAINSNRDALGAVATDRVITPITINGYEGRRFTAELASGNNSATLTGVTLERDGHVLSAIITDGLSNSANDVERFIASFVIH